MMNNYKEEKKGITVNLKSIIFFVLILLFFVITIITAVIGNSKKGNATNIIVEGKLEEEQRIVHSEFPLKFLQLENNAENMIYSPLSIKYALKMLNEGTNGNTKIQIENVIGTSDLTKYENIDEVLSLANGIYVRDNYASYVKEEYKKTLNEKYNAEINYDSFSNARNINKWIEKKTLGIIKNIVKDSVVQNPNTEMFLINALAIDMEWSEPFDFSDTYGKEFYLDNSNKVIATMMKQNTKSDSVSYLKDKDVTALTMDLKQYNDTQLEFIAIMPKNDLPDYIEEFTIDELNNIRNKSILASDTKYGVDVSIPKFSFDYNLNLNSNLIKLGITDAFDDSLADFSNMSNRKLYVGGALHKADIDFTEKGIKAAAVTVITMLDNAFMPNPTKPEEVKIDRPFLYVIRDKNTSEIWFVGTVYEPNLWEEDKVNY